VRGAWKLGRIGGIPLYADPSITILAALLTFNMWVAFSEPRFAISQSAAIGFSLLTAALFLSSILAHELAHAAMFRARGIPVARITLYMLGGATEATGEAKSPWDEFVAAAAGPATTAALWGLFRALHSAFGAGAHPSAVSEMFRYLALVNFLMAVFNLLPGFPLDGGRILLAGLWRITGDRARAIRTTARVGQGVALAIIGAAVALGLHTGDLLYGLWPAFIGWFLLRAATATLAEETQRRQMEATTVGQVMTSPPPAIDGDVPISVAMERYLMGHDGEAFPVMDSGHVAGFVSLGSARAIPLNRPVRDAIAGAGGTIEASPGEPMSLVGQRLRERRGHTVLVVDGGRLVGVIEPDDLDRFLRSRPLRGSPRVYPIPPRPDRPPR
jgi:Zn-dependent protease/CBS domain-containing protein